MAEKPPQYHNTMKTIQLYIIEAKGQKDEIHTLSLYTYKVFGSMKDAQEELDLIYNQLRTNKELAPIRYECSVHSKYTCPKQTWQIVPKFVSIAE